DVQLQDEDLRAPRRARTPEPQGLGVPLARARALPAPDHWRDRALPGPRAPRRGPRDHRPLARRLRGAPRRAARLRADRDAPGVDRALSREGPRWRAASVAGVRAGGGARAGG